MCIENYGFNPSGLPETILGTPARIIEVHRERFKFVCDAGEGTASLKRSVYGPGRQSPPTVGDFVMVDWSDDGDSRIAATLPRTTYFARRDPSSSGHSEQAVAANFDSVFIAQSLEGDFNERRLERYLALAWQSGATPVVVLTKADCTDDWLAHVRIAEGIALGTEVCAVSAKTGFGLERLAAYLQPKKTIVLLGSSGVGKSSLLNALAGNEVMAIREVREADGRGRHTTSHRQLTMLASGAMIIDTPGMRELGMWDAAEGMSQGFADVEQYFGRCKFNDCNHEGEPGCAIAEAIRAGDLAPDRWESYRKLKAEMRFSEDKEGYLRGKRKREKDLSKQLRELRKPAVDFRTQACTDSFTCTVCGALVVPEDAGSEHRNHCPNCLSSRHVDNRPGDRASLCQGVMEPIGVWVRKSGEWALIHRCASCGKISSNRIAADDNPMLLMSIATKPLANPPFPLATLGQDCG